MWESNILYKGPAARWRVNGYNSLVNNITLNIIMQGEKKNLVSNGENKIYIKRLEQT
jgi:hypothetical protein